MNSLLKNAYHVACTLAGAPVNNNQIFFVWQRCWIRWSGNYVESLYICIPIYILQNWIHDILQFEFLIYNIIVYMATLLNWNVCTITCVLLLNSEWELFTSLTTLSLFAICVAHGCDSAHNPEAQVRGRTQKTQSRRSTETSTRQRRRNEEVLWRTRT